MISSELIEEDFPNVSPIALVEQAARLMRDNSLHALPVVEGNRLRGVIACEDIVYRGIADGDDWFFAHAEDYMTRNPNVALNTDDNSSLVALMSAGRHKWLPIITANREYLGVIRLAALERFAPDMESSFP